MAQVEGPKVAFVFAAGRGERMRPISDTLPKPLVEVAGKALIDHTLDRLAENGVERAIVNVHWLADQIEAHLVSRERPRIVISDERERLLDQGGGLKKALPLIGPEPFFIANTDAFWGEGPRSNIARLIEGFDSEKMDAILLVASTPHAVGVDGPGDFFMSRAGRLTPRGAKLVAPFVYTGVAIVKPELIAAGEGDAFRLAPLLFAAAERERLYGVRLDGLWLHVGKPEAIARAERALARSTL